VSWISLRDAVGAIRFALARDELDGAVNAVAPQPVPQAEFARALGRALHRPVLVPVPALAIRLALGEQGEALLLHSARIRPARLAATGFPFADPELAPALERMLG
jgi:NAD dependent epimerase/dehydratase family enzyme